MEHYIQYPLNVRQKDPLHFAVGVTNRYRHFGGRVEEATATHTIDLEKQGIQNPLIARGLVGLLELGILRNPDHLDSLLDSSSQVSQLSTMTLKEIVHTSFDEQVGEIAVPNYMGIRSQFLADIYRFFPLLSKNNNFLELVDYLAENCNTEEGLKFLDTFIKTYIGIRRLVWGRIEDAHKTGKNRQQTVDDMTLEVEKKLLVLSAAHNSIFPDENGGYNPDTDKQSLHQTLFKEVLAGSSNIADISLCPFPQKGIRRHYVSGQSELVEISSHSELKHGQCDADAALIVRVKNGKRIPFHKMTACVFFTFANHQA